MERGFGVAPHAEKDGWHLHYGRHVVVACLLAGSLLQATAGGEGRKEPPVAGDDRALNVRMNVALRKGVDYLLQEKKKDNWEAAGRAGRTGLILYALLEVGRTIDDPRLRPNSPELAPVVAYLAARRPETAIEAAYQSLALTEAPPTPETKAATAQARETLLKLVRPDGSVAPRLDEKTAWNSLEIAWTYAALAALEDTGPDFDAKLWKNAYRWITTSQMQDGGWPVSSKNESAESESTAASLATLYLTTTRMPENGAGANADTPFRLGLAHLATDFEPDLPLGHLQLERAASAAGLKFIRGIDWYRTYADTILKLQFKDGAWPGPVGALFQGADPEVTAHTLLFLARGRAPVIFSKLEYPLSPEDPKAPARNTPRPRDLANLTLWLSHELDRPLNWQTLALDDPAAPWTGNLDSPILLITGAADPNFTPEQIARLRSFVEAGGLIFSVNTGADAAFTDAIVKKYAPLLSNKRYEMRTLPPNHDLFDAALFAKLPAPPPLLGLSNGVREWWIHSPTDFSATWQARKSFGRGRSSGGDAFLIPANLLRYATGNASLRNKLDKPTAIPTTAGTIARTIDLARLSYDGNADPEPAAWSRLAAIAPARFHTDIRITTLKPSELDPARTPVAHLTGTDAFTLSDADAAVLKKFLDDGGTLLADAAGASPKFTAAFLDLIKKLYPESKLSELPINDPLYNGSLADSFRLTEVQYRKYALLKMKESRVRPNIRALTINGRHVILFSPVDITSGLLGTETWGIQGYSPDSAFALARNMLLYAASGGNPAATEPSTQPSTRPLD